MSIDSTAFNGTAAYYDDWIAKAIPCFPEVFTLAAEAVPFDREREIRVLDLGSGTGIFARFICERFPGAEFVLIDLAEKMLAVARKRFAAEPSRFQFVVEDYRDLAVKKLGDFDLVISSLSIHHLEDSEKRQLFKDIFALLKAGGLFINLDQVRAETDALQRLYWDKWLEKVRQRGGSEEMIAASIQRREQYDKDALLNEQLLWLKEAGFAQVDCLYKHYFIGLFWALKSAVSS